MKLNDYDIIRRPLMTEKLDLAQEASNAVGFEVDRRANKIQIRGAVERLFGVKVRAVKTQVVPGKPKRIGMRFGHRPPWKKAIVMLAQGETIEFGEAAVVAEE